MNVLWTFNSHPVSRGSLIFKVFGPPFSIFTGNNNFNISDSTMQVYKHKFKLKFVNSKLVLSSSIETGRTVNIAKILSENAQKDNIP